MKYKNMKKPAIWRLLCICMALLVLCTAAAAEDGSAHGPGDIWYPDDPGQHWHPCRVEGCGERFASENHRWGAPKVEKEGSCTEDRVEVRACEVCQRRERYTIEAPGHSWDQGTILREPTCMKEGLVEYTCIRCSETRTQETPKLVHGAGGGWAENSSQHWKLCPACGTKVEAAGHSWTNWITGAAQKQSRFCRICGRQETRKTPEAPAADLVVVDGTGAPVQKSFVREGTGYAVSESTAGLRIQSMPHPFSDVSAGAWYAGAVGFAYSHDLLRGVAPDRFDPSGTMTRAMVATAIYRIEGEPGTGSTYFSDVPGGKWYSDPVNWAADQDILNGVGNGKFDPDRSVTREQLVTILYRYAGYLGLDLSGRGDLSLFTDSGRIAAYARIPMEWSVSVGLISGRGDGTVAPKATATRAEVATVLRALTIRVTEELGSPLA